MAEEQKVMIDELAIKDLSLTAEKVYAQVRYFIDSKFKPHRGLNDLHVKSRTNNNRNRSSVHDVCSNDWNFSRE